MRDPVTLTHPDLPDVTLERERGDAWVLERSGWVISGGSAATDGTVAEVLSAVGDDPTKAAAALEAERNAKNRSSLVGQLEAIANTHPESQED